MEICEKHAIYIRDCLITTHQNVITEFVQKQLGNITPYIEFGRKSSERRQKNRD